MSRLTALLDQYARRGQVCSRELVFDLARQTKYNGPVTFHFRDGIPRMIEGGRPVQVALGSDEGAGAPSPGSSALDNGRALAQTPDRTV